MFKIVQKPQFTLVGIMRQFDAQTTYKKIPQFWQEFSQSGSAISGNVALCIETSQDLCSYMIADIFVGIVPDGCMTQTIPAHTWAVFSCHGQLPDALQKVNTYVWQDWLPNNPDYALAANYNLEVYYSTNDEPYSEIWIPVCQK